MRELFLFDGTGLVYRAFYAIDQFLKTSTGMHTNALYGIAKMLIKFLKEHVNMEKDACAFILDSKGGSKKRKEILKDYKSNRPETPDLILEQLPYIEEFVDAFGVKVLKLLGYEADDIIATIAKRFCNAFEKVNIITGDKDLLQLVDEKVYVWRIERGITELVLYDRKKVFEKYGVFPEQFGDYLSLVGDQIDNIPGVKGIGKKTAVSLLKKYGTIDEVLKNKKLLTEKLQKLLENATESLEKSRQLVQLIYDVPLDVNIEDLIYKGYDSKKLLVVLKKYEFSSIIKELGLKEEFEKKYTIVNSEKELSKLRKRIDEVKTFSIDTETTSLDPFSAKLVGVSISTNEGEAYYIPISHVSENNLTKEIVLKFLKEILECERYNIVGQNLKFDYKVFMVNGIEPQIPHFDTMVAAYLINPEERRYNLEELALKYLGYKMISFEELVDNNMPLFGNDFSFISIEKAAEYSCEDVDITFRLYSYLSKYIGEMKELFYNIEMPLINVLAQMELNGVYFDVDYLKELSKRYEEEMKKLEEKIFEISGEQFNINSSKQVAEILFEKLKLPIVKKTATGRNSTNAEVLEELAKDYEIARLILEYRKFQKLKSTYVDSIPSSVNITTNRVHSSFHQTGTSTGRLSSSAPNLQNLPTRSEEGKEIRHAVKPQFENWYIVGADYSQIELRVLAHMSEDEKLLDAFENDYDIHTITASKIFNVSELMVTEDMRRIGKMINFAIIYGISPYGLSRRIGLNVNETKKIIDNYFKYYQGVFEFIKKTIDFAKKNGFVKTLFGRKRFIPQLKLKNKNLIQEGERIAINTPVQGTAADIIKIAMVKVHNELKRNSLKTKLILQVHDELVFEVPFDELQIVKEIIKDKMENAVKLKVPLKVDLYEGREWE
ncbi:DNA polymerase [Thermosipho melanesiensis]|uniref:DNA polymerase I n=2 Tax=Thermosipho melanesiensis TaxID=46541 RepID=A6LP98_THEM4|nr:DNA polymerase I [Thermosipho melanesiensis]ABR31749.1 DNA polymerase I [Thermosipho melanesiensis BI429]APT74771.1 DNA polymerase [Thermosipho melanesiensis]OOC35089.1 DNA polymerase [Thermosipho melanesiensis]OOC35125.1 DNA polymerase [Thermosipho melanesiensis]OOC36733.1 DNA polymerase [Thermosipho melanesiensis]